MIRISVCSVVKTFYLLPPSVGAAAENMAADWLLLEDFPDPMSARMRTYGWSAPAFTFGYGQKWGAARAACPSDVDLIRRPTGGGLVDHRADWTYALVLPPGHPLAEARACDSYRAVHEALAEGLTSVGVGCQLQKPNCQAPQANNFSVCFKQTERMDVVRADDGRKIAGAAQKRTRRGLLFQGSVSRPVASELKVWEEFVEIFARKLGDKLGATPEEFTGTPWPERKLAETAAQFAAKEWNEKR